MKAEIDVNHVGYGSIVIDGHDVANSTRGFVLCSRAGDVTVLELDLLLIDRTKLNAEVDVVVPAETRDILIKLGWTPPYGQSLNDTEGIQRP